MPKNLSVAKKKSKMFREVVKCPRLKWLKNYPIIGMRINNLIPIQTLPEEGEQKEENRLKTSLIIPKIFFPILRLLIFNSYASFWSSAWNSSIKFLLFHILMIKMGLALRIMKLYTIPPSSNLHSRLCLLANFFIENFYSLGVLLRLRRITWEKYMSSKKHSGPRFSGKSIEEWSHSCTSIIFMCKTYLGDFYLVYIYTIV